ncbi:LytR C-terminal domain-containing protein [Streptantibioticus ferralitis]|uniref:LytR C-terminal domain-containing protein n=1 Tax=Streptantibioticus ferralitis TaxID=236510 RepID=A0ABT5Z2T1_9ACTN|nr:LytR C-terminal domain-containing protein [Streptantibioticus ferralitis]MDF2257340.1 LytR C-terminal domain-containing protein [Streptantibioticus ferralitis]
MSMLTPPGMGGKYRITGNQYPRMRRPRNNRRIVLSAVAAVAVVGLIGWGTVQLIHVFGGRFGSSHTTASASHCAVGSKAGGAPASVPKPAAVTVNVYNATSRGGLAKTTADELKKRGFAVGKVGNAPAAYDKKVKGTAILLGGPPAQGALKVLGTQLAAADVKTDPSRTGAADVDLIIGDGFAALDPQKNADQALAALTQAAPTASSPGHAKAC